MLEIYIDNQQMPLLDSPSLQPMSRHFRLAWQAIGILIAITFGLLTWHHYGMNARYELTGGRYAQKVQDDGTIDAPVGERRTLRGAERELRCTVGEDIKAKTGCSLFIDIIKGAGEAGIDLTGFDELSIELDYHGPGMGKFGVVLIDSEDGLTDPARWETFKRSEVYGLELPADGKLIVPLRWLGVPQWWRDMAKPPMEHSYVRIDNVVGFELSLASWTAPGEHRYTIQSIALRGKLISQSTLLLGVVAMWIVSALAGLGLTALSLRRQLNASDAERALLANINGALKLEARELAGQAYHDPLTGALNRQGLRAELMRTSTLMADPMSVVFVDLDYFKRINDTHGHAAGDEVLRTFTTVVGAGIRQSDRLVRWGGEEFLIVCPLTNAQQAAVLAENLRLALHKASWPLGMAVTASFGIAKHQKNADMSVVIKHADEALYNAKAAGRDRVMVYQARAKR